MHIKLSNRLLTYYPCGDSNPRSSILEADAIRYLYATLWQSLPVGLISHLVVVLTSFFSNPSNFAPYKSPFFKNVVVCELATYVTEDDTLVRYWLIT
jgi:hypothetical protein